VTPSAFGIRISEFFRHSDFVPVTTPKLMKIIRGGQTGADRAALDFAIEQKIPHGGWCPKGRKAEDGPIALRYRLRETPSVRYSQRTEWNVRDSDGTVVFSARARLSGGSAKTVFFARNLSKPVLHLSRKTDEDFAHECLVRFLRGHKIRILNIAGPRASEDRKVYDFVKQILTKGFGVACPGAQKTENPSPQP
jgi:hypothetical protein